MVNMKLRLKIVFVTAVCQPGKHAGIDYPAGNFQNCHPVLQNHGTVLLFFERIFTVNCIIPGQNGKWEDET